MAVSRHRRRVHGVPQAITGTAESPVESRHLRGLCKQESSATHDDPRRGDGPEQRAHDPNQRRPPPPRFAKAAACTVCRQRQRSPPISSAEPAQVCRPVPGREEPFGRSVTVRVEAPPLGRRVMSKSRNPTSVESTRIAASAQPRLVQVRLIPPYQRSSDDVLQQMRRPE